MKLLGGSARQLSIREGKEEHDLAALGIEEAEAIGIDIWKHVVSHLTS